MSFFVFSKMTLEHKGVNFPNTTQSSQNLIDSLLKDVYLTYVR